MINFNKYFYINKKKVGLGAKTYFIADIASNHDKSLNRAIDLINLAKEAGADAAKFQNFEAKSLVSDYEFSKLNIKSHQTHWKKSVFDTYKDNEVNFKWMKTLHKECKKIGIDFLTAPYSTFFVNKVNKFIPAFKIGSGDITYHQEIILAAKKNKPIIIATGASSLDEVSLIIKKLSKINKNVCLMQCNTNYTGGKNNLQYLNLKVLNLYKKKFKNIILGLSDHTKGDLSVIAAVSMGAKVIEKHFTDSNKRIGPDHPFSMNPKSWKIMVEKTRDLEATFGDGIKKIEENEKETAILQRRSIVAKKKLKKNQKIKAEDLEFLRPKVRGSFDPYEIYKLKNKVLKHDLNKGEAVLKKNIK
jgi:sialic acid synthase SpsE